MTPLCCNVESKYVDLGPRLQYFYCGECKKEVNPGKDAVRNEEENDIWKDGVYRLPTIGAGRDIPAPNAGVNYQGTVPRPLDVSYDLVAIDKSPCSQSLGSFSVHSFLTNDVFDSGMCCNCGATYKA